MADSLTAVVLDQVTVIVVTYNSAHCVASLAESLSGVKNVIVVDNGSVDGCPEVIQRQLPRAELIRNGENRGFGAANNLALHRVKTPFAFLLNPDCETDAKSIQKLLAVAAENPDAAFVAPQLVSSSGLPEVNYRWPSTEWHSIGPACEGPSCVGFVCGAAMMFNMEVMSRVGFFDEEFFLYYEDDDLCRRVFDQKLQMLVIPEVRMTHRSRGSVGGKHRLRSEYIRGFHHAQSKIRYSRKYQGQSVANRLRWRTFYLALLSFPVRVLVPSPRHLARLAGRVAGLWIGDVRKR